ncbi:MAG: hypothetical protein SGPRY_014327, partial [Prymnesium sp.]
MPSRLLLLLPSLPPLPRGSLLSQPLGSLSQLTGHPPAARYLWRLLRAGYDPLAQWDSPEGAHEASRFGMDPSRRARIAAGFSRIDSIGTVVRETVASDRTSKLLLRLSDGLEVEAVLIPPLPPTGGRVAASARARTTLCISSQVGCRQGCSFCATGRMGKLRDLSVDEILMQAHHASRWAKSQDLPALSNV